MTLSEIIPNLFVGSATDAKQFAVDHPNAAILCVLEARPADEPLKSMHVSILQPNPENSMANVKQLDICGLVIDHVLKMGGQIMIHCMAGIQRGPLTVVWYLSNLNKISIDEAYKIVKEKHPETEYDITWLPSNIIGKAVIG